MDINNTLLELIEQLPLRQRETFDYMILGYGYKEVGVIMGISREGVGNHAYKVLKHLDLPDRLTLILKYYNLPNWMEGELDGQLDRLFEHSRRNILEGVSV
jgi:DNA-binding CsgD family transcriptional regulator